MKRFGAGIAVGAVAAVTMTGVAYGATGGAFVLGRSNTASSQTLLTNSSAGSPVLALSTRPGQVPLAVSAHSGKALHLNADRLDGFDASSFASAEDAESTLLVYEYEPLTRGIGVASCPDNWRPTGGGVIPNVTTGLATVVASAPNLDSGSLEDGWLGAVLPAGGGEYDGSGSVFVSCTNAPVYDRDTGVFYAKRRLDRAAQDAVREAVEAAYAE